MFFYKTERSGGTLATILNGRYYSYVIPALRYTEKHLFGKKHARHTWYLTMKAKHGKQYRKMNTRAY